MIFVSYAGPDRSFAKYIESIVVSRGFSIWIDYHDLSIETDIYGQISRAISDCNMIVYLNSIASFKSDWVNVEKSLAKSFNKPYLEFDIENSNRELHENCPELNRFFSLLKLTYSETLKESLSPE